MSDITVGSVAVSVVPDARGFREKLSAQLRNLTADITVNADLAHLREQLAEATRSRPVTINVDADTTKAAAQIAEVARNRRATITTDVDRSALSNVSSSLSGISGLGAGIVALGPALIPVIAAVGGLVALLAAPIAFAAGGLTLFGLLAGFAVKGTQKQVKAIGDLSKKVASDRLALAKASTPSGKKSAMLQLASDTKAYQAQLAALTPAQKRFMDAQGRLKESFHKLVVAAGGAIFGPLIKGMNLLSTVLPKLAPAIRPIAAGISTLLGEVSKAAKGPAFKDFVKTFGTTARDAIVGFGQIFGNVSKGLFNLFQAFGPASKTLVDKIGGMAQSFAKFDFKHSKTFQSFLAYVRDVGPKVARAFGDIFDAVSNLLPVLVPLAGASLALVDGIAKLIAKADPKTLAIIAAAVSGILLAFGVVNPATIIGLAAGLGFLVSKSEPLKKAFQGLAGWVRHDLMPALSDAGKKVLPALIDAFDSVRSSVRKNHGLFEALATVIKATGVFITKVLIPAMGGLYSVEFPLLGKAISAQITFLRLLGSAFTAMALVGIVSVRLLLGGVLSAFGGILTAADKAFGWLPGIGPKIHAAKVGFDKFKDGTVAALDEAAAKVLALQLTLDNLKPKKTVTVFVKVKATDSVEVVGAKNKLNGLLSQRATGGPVVAGQPYIVGERRPELFVPETNGRIIPEVPSGGGATGPQFQIDKVVAQDVNDFLSQMQVRARHSSLDGIRR